LRALSVVRELTPEQAEAVARRQGALLLAAGAGSGKTSVLVERFVRAVLEDGIAPGRILAITFTERAAGELKARVRARFLELGERQAARDTEAAHVSTFHGFCARLLRAHPLLAGLDPRFTILEEVLAGRLRLRAFRAAASDFIAREGEPAVDLIAAYGIDRVRGMILGSYAELRSRGQHEPRLPTPRPRGDVGLARAALAESVGVLAPELSAAHETRPGSRLQAALAAVDRACELIDDVAPASALAALKLPTGATGALSSPACEAYRTALARYTEACADYHGAQTVRLLDGLLADFAGHYAELKRQRAGLDFDDLELRARALLAEHEDVRASWAERMQLLMVDEFQDTNHRQLALLEMLAQQNLFTVGDELQSIYGFRHADVEIFRSRGRELAAEEASLHLKTNFRSRPPLIAAINEVFETRFGERYTPLVAGREPASDHTGGEAALELLLTDKLGWEERACHWREAEAQLLAQRVAELVRDGKARPGEVVLLLRAVGDLPLYERALQQRGLSTLASVGSFWTQQQVGDLLSYLRTLTNPLDELALYSTLASPLVGVSSEGLVLLARAAKASGRDLWSTVQIGAVELEQRLSPGDSAALNEFRVRLPAERRSIAGRGVAELLRRAIAASGYERHVLRLSVPERRLANIHKLLRLARTYEDQEGRDLRGFLEHVAHQEAFMEGAEPQAPASEGEPDAVRLMSIHAAKGLEFPVVCVADLGRAVNLGLPDLLLDERGVGLRLVGLDGGDSLPCLDFERLSEQRRRAEAEEEERIVYVAMTRARERLLLSGGVDFERWPEAKAGAAPIAWLGPALVADLPERTRTMQEPTAELGTVRYFLNAPATLGSVLREAEGVPEESGPLPRRSRSGEPSDGQGVQLSLIPAAPTAVHAEHVGVTPGTETHAAVAVWVATDPTLTLSYTALGELERCGYRYYLERVLGLPEDRASARANGARRGLAGRARGILVHRLLESFDFVCRTPPTAADVARVARELGLRVSPAEREELAALVGAASATDLAQRLGSAPRVRRELPFAFLVGAEQTLVNGVLDAVVGERSGDVLIVDYKSDTVAENEDLELLVERDYGSQRLIYALAALQDGAPAVEIVHWFLRRPSEAVCARYTAADLPQLRERLAQRIERARTRGFAVSEIPHRALCETCPGRGGMCSWGERETLRELAEPVGVAVGDST
jgi:ATP-dependent helicase/nuclease subunit A